MTQSPYPMKTLTACILMTATLATSSVAQEPKIWWNQERFVAGLSLEEAQRQAMDAILEKIVSERRETLAEYRTVRSEMIEALVAGDAETVAAAGESLAETSAALSRLETELMLQITGEMSAEQRREMRRDYPGLFTRLWLVGGRRGLRGGSWAEVRATRPTSR